MTTDEDSPNWIRFLPLVYGALQRAHYKRHGRYLKVSEVTRDLFFECYANTVVQPHYHVVGEWTDLKELSRELDEMIDLQDDPVTKAYSYWDGEAYRIYEDSYSTSPMVQTLVPMVLNDSAFQTANVRAKSITII